MGLLRSNFRYTLQFLWQRFWNILDDFESIDSRSDEHHHFWWALQQKQSQTLGLKLRLSNGCQFCVSIGTPINRHKSIYVLFMRFAQRWQDSNFHCWSSSMLSLWETYTAITQPTKNQVPYFQTNPYRGFLFSQQIWLPWVLVHADGSYTQEGAQASAVGCPVHSFHFVPTCSYCVRLCPFGFMALLTPGRSYCQAQCLWASSCNIRVWAMPGSLLCRNGHWAMPENLFFCTETSAGCAVPARLSFSILRCGAGPPAWACWVWSTNQAQSTNQAKCIKLGLQNAGFFLLAFTEGFAKPSCHLKWCAKAMVHTSICSTRLFSRVCMLFWRYVCYRVFSSLAGVKSSPTSSNINDQRRHLVWGSN